MLKLLSLLCLVFVGAHEETTVGLEKTIVNGKAVYSFSSQLRDNSPAFMSMGRGAVSTSAELVVQDRGTYFRGPTGGSRTRAVESRGGVAATQICGGPIEITNTRGECRELVYDRDFLQVLQTEGLSCARDAAQAAFGFRPTRIGFRTGEGQVSATRRSANGKFSAHSVGRALDVFEVDIYNGPAHNSVLMHGSYMNRRGHRTFYSQFRDCWKGIMQGGRGGIAGACGSGALDYNYNSAHWDHMHISLSPLDVNRRGYGLNCI